jgi:hypothetical protein
MKNLILIAVILIGFSCKKKTVTPEPTLEPVCIKSPDQFSGKYVSPNNDTIEVIYLHDNCPKDKSNVYLVKGIGKAAQSILKSGETFDNVDYDTISNEPASVTNYSNVFSLGRQSNGNLLFNSYKINSSNYQFTKI